MKYLMPSLVLVCLLNIDAKASDENVRCDGPKLGTEACCTVHNPCEEGEGECEVDKDCRGDLVCGKNKCKTFGSIIDSLQRTAPDAYDCCVKLTKVASSLANNSAPSYPLTEPYPGQRCSGRNYQGRRCCTPDNPCDEGEGDCDGPGDGGGHDGSAGCKGGLVCGSNNCKKFGTFYHEKDDCCENPSTSIGEPETVYYPGALLLPPPGQRCSGRNYQGRRCCTPQEPCDEGEGDCDGPGDGGGHDGHAGCKGDLVCGSNNCKKFGAYFHKNDDCCENPTGGWGEWEAWSNCSKTCGGGRWRRERSCTGTGCRNKHQVQGRFCNTQICSP